MCANCKFTPEGQCSFPKWDLSGEITYKYYASEHLVIISILLSQLKFALMRNVTWHICIDRINIDVEEKCRPTTS